MIKYFLDKQDESPLIRLKKDYQLRLDRNSNNLSIIKKNQLFKTDEKSNKVEYCPERYLKGDDIFFQLANIRHVGFEVTDSCNLNCVYCIYGKFYENHDLRTNKKIDISQAKKLIDYLFGLLTSSANMAVDNEVIVSFYGGEPLLNINFIEEMVSYTKSLNRSHVHFKYMMTTNAVYLKKYINFLSANEFKILISLDGSRENDGYRIFQNGESSFDIVYQNLKYVQKNFPEYFSENISFNSVLHSLNNISDVYSFIYNEFGKVPNISSVNNVGVRPEMKDKFDKMSNVRVEKIDAKLKDEIKNALGLKYPEFSKLQDFLFVYSGNTFSNYNYLLKDREKVRIVPTATCVPFSRRIFMTVNNKILPCERIGQQFYLGRVTNDGVCIDCEKIAEKYNKYYWSLKNQCDQCYKKEGCSKCMFHIPDLEENPKCTDFMNENEFLDELKDHLNKILEDSSIYRRMLTEVLVAE